jgi:uncharacterized protein YjiS (DUF1127 family)
MTIATIYEGQRHTGVAVAPAISTVLSWIGQQLDRRRVRLALLELSDEQLRDIGLSRSEAYGLSSSRAYAEELRRLRG